MMSLFISGLIGLSMIAMQEKSVMQRDLEKMINGSGATIAVAAEHLGTGKQILIDEKRMFHAASTMKTPVMIEVYQQAAGGRLALSDSIEIRNAFRSIVDSSVFSMDLGEDSDDEVYKRVGSKMSVSDLVYAMITVSSNFATNVLIDLVDAKKVTATMRELGAADIKVLRGVEDLKAYRLGMNNETNAFDLLVIMKAIASGTAVSAEASSDMVRVLLDQKFGDKIPGKLPKDVRVAHKTGSITGVEHDSGIVFMADGQAYVLVLLSDGWEDQKAGRGILADISRRIYDHYAKGM